MTGIYPYSACDDGGIHHNLWGHHQESLVFSSGAYGQEMKNSRLFILSLEWLSTKCTYGNDLFSWLVSSGSIAFSRAIHDKCEAHSFWLLLAAQH